MLPNTRISYHSCRAVLLKHSMNAFRVGCPGRVCNLDFIFQRPFRKFLAVVIVDGVEGPELRAASMPPYFDRRRWRGAEPMPCSLRISATGIPFSPYFKTAIIRLSLNLEAFISSLPYRFYSLLMAPFIFRGGLQHREWRSALLFCPSPKFPSICASCGGFFLAANVCKTTSGFESPG